MRKDDVVEYYDGEKCLLRIHSSVVPEIGRKISILGAVWNVQNITHAIDHSESITERQMRTNIDLVREYDRARAKWEGKV